MTTIGGASSGYYRSYHYGANKASSDASNFPTEAAPSKQKGAASVGGDASPQVDSWSSAVMLNLQGKLLALEGPIGYGSDLTPVDFSEWPEDRYQAFMEGEQRRIEANERYLQHQYSSSEAPDLSNYAGIKPYAEIVVGSRVVATIDNQGVVSTQDDRLGERLYGLSASSSGKSGPDLAQKLADQIAGLLGGRVERADTAITQSQFDTLSPPPRPSVTVDYEAMKKDPLYSQIQRWTENFSRIEQQRADYLTRQQSGVDISV